MNSQDQSWRQINEAPDNSTADILQWFWLAWAILISVVVGSLMSNLYHTDEDMYQKCDEYAGKRVAVIKYYEDGSIECRYVRDTTGMGEWKVMK